MRRTEYITMTKWSISNACEYRRVYQDEDGKHYIKKKGDYLCIDDLPCGNRNNWSISSTTRV